MRKVIISTSIVLLLFLFFWYLSKSEYDRKQDLKKYPKKFAYYIHRGDSSVSRALGSDDSGCVVGIREYYTSLDNGISLPIPACATFSVGLDKLVHVLSEEDSLVAKVAYFYVASNGREKYLIGYLLRDNLHKIPYAIMESQD